MIIGIIGVSLWIATMVGWVIFNLYNKNKKLETIANNYANFSNEMVYLVKEFDEIVNKIDSQIWVQSDPELLALFDKIKEMQRRSKEFLG
jgi:hypothetical protein